MLNPPLEKALPNSFHDADEKRANYQNVPLADFQSKKNQANGTEQVDTLEPVEPSNIESEEEPEPPRKVLAVETNLEHSPVFKMYQS